MLQQKFSTSLSFCTYIFSHTRAAVFLRLCQSRVGRFLENERRAAPYFTPPLSSPSGFTMMEIRNASIFGSSQAPSGAIVCSCYPSHAQKCRCPPVVLTVTE